MGRRFGAPPVIRRSLILLALAGCGDTSPPPQVVAAGVPPPPTSRFDGNYRGTANRSFGNDLECGPATNNFGMVVAQGRATSSLPLQGQATGIVLADGSLTLRSGQDATERTAGRITDRFAFNARYQTRQCAWDLRLNRV